MRARSFVSHAVISRIICMQLLCWSTFQLTCCASCSNDKRNSWCVLSLPCPRLTVAIETNVGCSISATCLEFPELIICTELHEYAKYAAYTKKRTTIRAPTLFWLACFSTQNIHVGYLSARPPPKKTWKRQTDRYSVNCFRSYAVACFVLPYSTFNSMILLCSFRRLFDILADTKFVRDFRRTRHLPGDRKWSAVARGLLQHRRQTVRRRYEC